MNKLPKLLRHVDYIRKERVKIQSFVGGLPQIYRDIIEFVDPCTLDEVIRMAMHCYEQSKSKSKLHPKWKIKQRGRFDQRKRGFKP